MHRFEAELWRWDGDAAWPFVTVPDDVSDDIEEASGPVRRGFGSVRVQVTIGGSTLDAGDRTTVTLEVLDQP